MRLLAVLTAERAAEATRSVTERAATAVVLAVLAGLIAGAACLLLLLGISDAIALALPVWAARVIVGGGILLLAAVAIIIARRGRTRRRLDKLRHRHADLEPLGIDAETEPALDEPSAYLEHLERQVRGDLRTSTVGALSRLASVRNVAFLGGASFLLGRFLRRKPMFVGLIAASVARLAVRRALSAFLHARARSSSRPLHEPCNLRANGRVHHGAE